MTSPQPESTQPAWQKPALIIVGVVILGILIWGLLAALGVFGEKGPAEVPPTQTPVAVINPSIDITIPDDGAVLDITRPVEIQGKGQGLHEGNVVVQAVDTLGSVLAQAATTLQGKDVGTGGEGTWTVKLDLRNVKPGTQGFIVAFSTKPVADGTSQRVVENRVTVTFGTPATPIPSSIRILEPSNGMVLDIQQPVTVQGEGEGLLEGNVVVQALDNNNQVLAQQATTLQGDNVGAGGKGTWSVTLDLSHVQPGTQGKILAFSTNPSNGEHVAETSIQVTYGQAEAPTPEPGPSTLEGPLWLLTQINGQQPVPGSVVYAIFQDGQVSGSGGCNNYHASYQSDDQNLTISPLAMTRKACAEPAGVMEQEATFGQLMSSAATYSTANGMLTIFDANGSPMLIFTPAVAGTLNYKARIALPEDAQVVVTLEDISKADAPAQVIGQTTMKAPAGPPIPFAVTYNLSKIQPNHTYGVRAVIQAADGTLLFTSDQAYPVITQGNPSYVDIELVQP